MSINEFRTKLYSAIADNHGGVVLAKNHILVVHGINNNRTLIRFDYISWTKSYRVDVINDHNHEEKKILYIKFRVGNGNQVTIYDENHTIINELR